MLEILRQLRVMWSLLTEAERRRAGVLFVRMLIGMVLEILGIGLVMPALSVLTQPGASGLGSGVFADLASAAGLDQRGLVLALMGALFALFLGKGLFMAYLYLSQARFVHAARLSISTRLFGLYLSQPFVFHMHRNSASLVQILTSGTQEMAFTFLNALNLVVELLVLVGIGTVLVVLEPVGALVVLAVVGLTSWLLLHATRRELKFWGGEKQRSERLVVRQIQEGLGAIKELTVMGREAAGLRHFRGDAEAAAHAGVRLYTYPQLPRLGLETVGIGALALLSALFVVQGRPLESMLPSIGLFAAAAFRVMPSANRVLSGAQGMQAGAAAIRILEEEFATLRQVVDAAPVDASAVPQTGEIVADGVEFTYPGAPSPVLVDVHLAIARGTSVGFIGASGAGKSTLVDLLLGLLEPGRGQVRVGGVDIHAHARAWRAQLGYVPQTIFLVDDTLRRNVALGIPDDEIDEDAVWRALRAAQLDGFVRDLPDGLDTVVGERGVRLSGGQRQRIGIARVLFHDPPVLVLDEATSALDTETEAGVMAAVQALHGTKTILIIAHRLSTLRHCERVYRLEAGRLEEAPVGDALATG